MKHFMVLIFALLTTLTVHAQNYGFIAGIGNTSVDADGFDVNAELGYRLGLAVEIDLVDAVNLRTGATYTYRPFNIESGVTTDLDYKFSYIDIPMLFQFKLNEMFSVFAGPVVAINMGKKAEGTLLGVNVSDDVDDMKSLYLLGQVGVNLDFEGIGFDLYYEKGFGEIYDDGAEDYNIYGANFLYWF